MAKSIVNEGQHYFIHTGDVTICKMKFSVDMELIPGDYYFGNDISFKSDLMKTLNVISQSVKLIPNYSSCSNLVFEVTARTDRQGDDVYDETIGEHIALTKAQRMMFNTAKHIVKRYIDYASLNIMEELERAYFNESTNEQTAIDHFHELIK